MMVKIVSQQPVSNNLGIDEDDEFLLDEVKGVRTKRKMSILNKNKLSDEELFNLLGEDYLDGKEI